jgi:predicted dehydrogenase
MAQSSPIQRKITIAVVGMGNRGQVYSEFAHEHPELCELVALAEPRPAVRVYYAKYHNVPAQNVFSDWRELAAQDRLSDAVIIATQDKMHAEPAIAFASKGYHILLEKPMAVSEAECRAIVDAVQKNHIIFAVGHVLRYTPYSQTIKQIVDSGRLGRIINIQRLEPVVRTFLPHKKSNDGEKGGSAHLRESCILTFAFPGFDKKGFWHFAHSYVRGPWKNEKEATFSLLAKVMAPV